MNAEGEAAFKDALEGITNDDGKSVLDMRSELRDAAQSALVNGGGRGDVRDAIMGTLESSGFDVEELKSAMSEAGAGRRPGLMGGMRAYGSLGSAGSSLPTGLLLRETG